MAKVSRRTLIGTVLPGVVIGTVLVGRAKAAPIVEDQPHMRAALDHLRSALNELNGATSDKGGHRVKAIKLVENAIAQVEEGIRYDNRH